MLARKARRRRPSKQVGSEKLAVSFDRSLARKVRRAAGRRSAGNVSAWLAEAARERLRLEAGHAFLKDFEAEYGAITDKEVAEVRRRWPRD
jgi:hypothetical protein